MNGYHIGGSNPVTRQRNSGVWTPNDPELKELGMAVPTDGLINHWPLTADANDIVGSAHLTNNNSVAFSSAGARLEEGAKRYLSATYTFPAVGTIVYDLRVDTGKFICLGAQGSDGKNSYVTFVGVYQSQEKIRGNAPGASNGATCGGSYLLPYPVDDGKYHTIARVVYNRAPGDEAPCAGVLFFDGVCIGGVAFYPGITLSTAFAVGRSGAYDGGYGDGYVRDLRIFNRILTAGEIRRLSV